jgi:esterase/lipase superfamily enzyme
MPWQDPERLKEEFTMTDVGLSNLKPFSGPMLSRLAKSSMLFAALLLVGCATQRPLMPTPSVYSLGIKQPFATSLPTELKTVNARLLYVTDRVPEPQQDGRLDYGVGRDPALAVGEAVVNIGGDTTWEELASDARTGVRARTLTLGVVSVKELARTPKYPLPYTLVDGWPVTAADSERKLQEVGSTVHEMLQGRLAAAPRKELLIYVHGVGNTFDDALYTTAELWHFLGREFVPVAYTWPAGHGGLLRGYNYDRESSEFTVFHFKRFLTWLSSLPDVEGIHIIAHSRGSDVVVTSLRELVIEARARGEHPQDRYKLRNVVLAAPDLNIEVLLQRTTTEAVTWAAERWTTYTSPGDKAISISEYLFDGGRFGRARYTSIDDLPREFTEFFAAEFGTARDIVIEYEGEGEVGGQYGHNYFRTNPAVASDLVLAVRYGRNPGADQGRPLKHLGAIFWEIDDNYLQSLN